MLDTGPASTLSTFTATDGDNLAVQDWPLPAGVVPRGTVLIVHGLGEHAGRYHHVARRLNRWGFVVRGYDQYGHGVSGGVRGALPTPDRLLDDLEDLIASTRARHAAGQPLVLLGHSMGGLVAATYVARRLRPLVQGLVLSSPAFAPHLSPVQKFLLSFVPRIAPHLTLGNGLDPRFLSHDQEVVAAYRNDPMVHDRISGRLAKWIADGGPAVVARAATWEVPTLLMYAGDDHLVDPGGSSAFAAAAPPHLVAVRCFERHYHELFNEVDAEPVFETLREWLDEQFA